MLTVAKVTQGSATGYADYLDGRVRPSALGDYYLKDGDRVEAPGRWAAGAGLVGGDPDRPVTGEQLRALMAVQHPVTGRALRRLGGSGEAVAALDATFSAPKSVSAIWAIADADLRGRIEQAHEQAIDRALDYSLRYVAMIRHRVDHGAVVHAKPVGVIATSWRHTTARAVHDQAPDPQLHSHVLLHGAVRRDGRIVAIDSRSWLVHRRELGAAYRSELARHLAALGFEVERETGRGGRYFEIAGVPQPLVDKWSSRHHQVQAAIHQRIGDQRMLLEAIIDAGAPDAEDAVNRLALLDHAEQLAPRDERQMATSTRSAKSPVTAAELDGEWRRTAAGHGLDQHTVRLLREPRSPLAPARPARVLEGLVEFDATFPARDARAVALERSAGAPIDQTLDQLRRLRASDEILVLADRSGTTREHRAREQATVSLADRFAGQAARPIAPEIIERETERLDRELAGDGGRLSGEQRDAIRLACGDRPFVVIEGQAGTGKSTTLTGIARAHQAAGREILVTSTAALAAERLTTELADAGVEATAYSTAALDAGIESGRVRLGPWTTVIHDEAALASTREQHQLLTHIERTGARLIAVGDPAQNQPVGAGGLWHHLETTARRAGGRVELTRNQRARDPQDRRDQARFRAGEHELAIRAYAERGHAHLASDQARAEDRALDAAQADRVAGRTTIVIAQTSNTHLDELNARAQAIRQQAGELGNESVPIRGRPYRLHVQDDVQVRRTIPHPRTTQGRLRNGTRARIAAIDPNTGTVELELTNGGHVRLDQRQVAAADVRLAYVQHPFPAQGQTTDTAHLIVAEHATREGSYVAITRARDRTHIYAAIPADPGADRLGALAGTLGRSEPELPSISAPLAHEHAIASDPDAHLQPTPPDDRGRHTELAPTTPQLTPAAPGQEAEIEQPRRRWPGRARPENARTRSHEIPGWEP